MYSEKVLHIKNNIIVFFSSLNLWIWQDKLSNMHSKTTTDEGCSGIFLLWSIHYPPPPFNEKTLHVNNNFTSK